MTSEVRYSQIMAQKALFWPVGRVQTVDEIRERIRGIKDAAFSEPPQGARRGEVASYLERARVVQGEILLLQKCLTLLERLDQLAFTDMYISITAMCALLAEVRDINVPVATKVERVLLQNPAIPGNCPFFLANELYTALDAAMQQALQQARASRAPTVEALEREVATHRERKIILKGQLPSLTKELWECQAEEVAPFVQELRLAYDASYKFWQEVPYKIWASYKTPYFGGYRQTGLCGEEFEAELGQMVGGLQKKVTDTFERLMRAGFDGDGYSKEIDRCCLLTKSVITNLDVKYDQIFEKEADGLFVHLLKYANFVRISLAMLTYSLDTMKLLATDQPSKLFSAVRASTAYLAEVSSSRLQVVRSLETVERAFVALQALNKVQPNDFPDSEVKDFLLHTYRTTKAALTRCASEDVALLPVEHTVWDVILKKKPIASLRYQGEREDLLPASVQGQIIKRIIEVLYLSDEKRLDPKLELLLYAVKKHPAYHETCASSHAFTQAIGEYDKLFQPGRNGESLARAYKALRSTFLLETAPIDVRTYSRIAIECIEFASDLQGEYHVLLSAFIYEMMDAYAGGKYTPIDRTKTLTTLRGAVSIALYGTKNKKEAQKFVYAAFQNNEVKDLTQDLMQLLYENTMRKLVRKERFHPNEIKALSEGPIKAFIAKKLLPHQDRRLLDALYTLVRDEQKNSNRPLTKLLDETIAATWLESYQRFIASTPGNHSALKRQALQDKLQIELGEEGYEAFKERVGHSIALTRVINEGQ